MEDNLNFFEKTTSIIEKMMQPGTSKIKVNGCGTAPGNLVVLFNNTSFKPLPFISKAS